MSVMSSAVTEEQAAGGGQRIRARDVRAFDALVETHYARLCTYARAITRGSDTAEEVVQDVLLAVWERRASLVGATGIQQYLYRAVRNRALNVVRGARREARVRVEAEREAAVAAGGSACASAEADLLAEELDAAVRRAIARLPAASQAAYRLRWEGEHSYAEIAAHLGVAVKTVETRVGRALAGLRRELRRFAEPSAGAGAVTKLTRNSSDG
jgi:RNA polymerase sigma-70 factor (ECF subfamily)